MNAVHNDYIYHGELVHVHNTSEFFLRFLPPSPPHCLVLPFEKSEMIILLNNFIYTY